MAHQHNGVGRGVVLALSLSLATIASLYTTTAARAETPQPILQVQGVLEEGDNVLDEDNTLYDVHSFEGKAGQSITISLESDNFDTYVLIADAEGKVLGENDDASENNSNSQIEIVLPRDGIYHIIVNGYESKDRGSYTLTVN